METIKKIVKERKEKEFLGHIQFVPIIARELWERYGGDWEVIELASLLHDFGRGTDLPHEIIGANIE